MNDGKYIGVQLAVRPCNGIRCTLIYGTKGFRAEQEWAYIFQASSSLRHHI